MRPRILIASWYRWPSTARLAAALIEANAEVDVVCLDLHPILRLKGLARRFRFSVLSPGASLRRAVEQSEPHFVVPCDHVVLEALERLRLKGGAADYAAIMHCLPEAARGHALTSRAAFMREAERAGVLCPPTSWIQSRDDLARWVEAHGLPAFLKVDRTWGGDGVRCAADFSSATRCFDELSRRPSLPAAVRQILRRQESSKLRDWVGARPTNVSVQAAVPGGPANCSAFAWRGEVQAVVAVEVLRTVKEFGVATRVVPVENAAIEAAAHAVARRLGLSGFFGLDFMLDKLSGTAWLIELNPRPTQISHMNFGPGRDLIGAMLSQVLGVPAAARVRTPADTPIDLFPHCLAESSALSSTFHDIPRQQAKLLEAFRHRRRHSRSALQSEPTSQPIRV